MVEKKMGSGLNNEIGWTIASAGILIVCVSLKLEWYFVFGGIVAVVWSFTGVIKELKNRNSEKK